VRRELDFDTRSFFFEKHLLRAWKAVPVAMALQHLSPPSFLQVSCEHYDKFSTWESLQKMLSLQFFVVELSMYIFTSIHYNKALAVHCT
jgi:hypothetical protein